MTDSNRELILQSLKGTLENITIANGFDNNITQVARKMLSYDDPTISFPVLMILGGGEAYEDTLGSYTISTLRAKVRGYSKDEAHPEEALNGLMRDVQKVLEDSKYNPYLSSYRPISMDTDEGWLCTEMNGLALFEMTIEMRYKFRRDTP